MTDQDMREMVVPLPNGWECRDVAAPRDERTTVGLATLPLRFAQPDPSTLATIPKGGVNLSYMGHAEVTLALIEADPLWTWEPIQFDPETGGPQICTQGNRLVMWGRLTVLGVSRLCVGTCEARKGDPEKELIGDLLRNGAMRFGIGTKLWSKATDADPAGSGPAGGYDRPSRPAKAPRASQEARDLLARCKAAPEDVKATLREFASENGHAISPQDFDADPKFADQVAWMLGNDGTESAA